MFNRYSGKLNSNANMIGRKDFLVRTGLLIGGGMLASSGISPSYAAKFSPPSALKTWEDIKSQFNLDPGVIQMSHFFLTSHPKPVREAIEKIRDGLDKNPVGYFHENVQHHETSVLNAAAKYLGVNPMDIALTDSTTMGLGLIYSSLDLKPDQEILTTTHDHYSTETALRLRAERTGAKIKRVSLYKDGEEITSDQIVENFIKNISSKTRYAVVTWVHSCTGMKLPIAKMSAALKEVNKNRDEKDKVIFCVDGVHGLGVENISLPELGCDFFIAGTHKWVFAPRGTGLVWAKPEVWKLAHATIPTFSGEAYGIWMNVVDHRELTNFEMMTPGGFHSFEHRWAVDKAFEFHQTIGRQKVQDRIHALNTMTKQRLSEMKKVKLITPMTDELSAGMTCFTVEGKDPFEFTEALIEKHIEASVTPYKKWYVRLAPSLVTLEDEVEKTLKVIEGMI
jgi:isopenicillin-N epimerase